MLRKTHDREAAMDKAGRLQIFVAIAEHGSIAAAARSLGLTPSAVSRALNELERALGAALMHRTTRKLQLTEDGSLVLARAREVLGQIDALESEVAQRRARISGTVRLGLPVPIGRHIVWPRMHRLLDRHPDLKLVCLPAQEQRAMQEQNFDVMLMAGTTPPLTRLVARRLATGRPAIYGSPAYLRLNGEPRHPEDLARHRCLAFHGPWMQLPATEWHFRRGDETCSARIDPRVVTQDREGLIVAAMHGAGLIRMACFDPALVAQGRLVPVLRDWTCTDGFHVYAVHRRGAAGVPRVRAVLDFLREAFAEFDPEQVTLVGAS
jgi:LysR family transcriptional regulator, transcriptional activator for dmlA